MVKEIIYWLHILFIIFVVFIPLASANEKWLCYHLLIVSLMMVHWIMNNNTCALTWMESKLTGEKKEKTFLGKLVNPVYQVTDKQIWIITGILLMVSMLKLGYWFNFGIFRKGIAYVSNYLK